MDFRKTVLLSVIISNLLVTCYCGPLSYIFAYNEIEKPGAYGNIEVTQEVKIVQNGNFIVRNEMYKETVMYKTRENTNSKDDTSQKGTFSTGAPAQPIRDVSAVEQMSAEELAQELRRIMDAATTTVDGTSPLWAAEHVNEFDAAVLKSIYDKIKNIIYTLTCDACKVFVAFIQELVAQKKSKAEIAEEVTKVCILLRVESERICRKVTVEFEEEVVTVFDKIALSPNEVCGLLVGDSCAETHNPEADWNVTFPKIPKPPVQKLTQPPPDAPKLRIIHLSDIHMDFMYKAGSNAECGEPVCCRKDDGAQSNKSAQAGYWGDYRNCDTPTRLIEALFQHLKENETFDYIYWTGDLPGHADWEQSREDQVAVQKYINKLFLEYFPGKLVFPSIGNHESAPVNSFPPPYVTGNDSMSWLYDVLAENWTHWLPQDTIPTIKKGSYYTVLLKPGFRIVSLNMNFCNNMNWWMLLNITDPAGELQWLISILQYAEDNHEKVHILGHIPSGSGVCIKHWSWNFYKIINRYENVIRAQFYGHTHTDSYMVYYDDASNYTRPTSIGYVGPSVTPYGKLNPGYRVYTVDGIYDNSTFTVLDHTNYIVNLTEANKSKQPPKWQREYSAKEDYQMPTLFPDEWDKLAHRMMKNDTLFDNYFRHYNKLSPYQSTTWNNGTRFSMVCEVVSGRSSDRHACDKLRQYGYRYEAHKLWQSQQKVRC